MLRYMIALIAASLLLPACSMDPAAIAEAKANADAYAERVLEDTRDARNRSDLKALEAREKTQRSKSSGDAQAEKALADAERAKLRTLASC